MLNKDLRRKMNKAKLESPFRKKLRMNSLYILSGVVICTSLGFCMGASATADEIVRSVNELKPTLQPRNLDELRERDGQNFREQEDSYAEGEIEKALEEQKRQELQKEQEEKEMEGTQKQTVTVQNMNAETVRDYVEETYQVTAYTADKECSGNWGRQTSTGKTATEGRTIAVDPDYIPYGTRVEIDGQIYIAEDCGEAVKGKVIDIYMNSLSEAKNFGRQTKTVKIYK